ncbi:hypothetical protein RFI_14824 [Reticulomyxa filosa]|uniref:Uncharacterized protein n=1 Tax=Reticulomyxa filosa TaxID=46433 RepID=X6N9H5_RETFI|nr:hypothetical protein RFI_14824 [Reticulomyxa filosa]|eukprot:ETO22374.1 hypothetical protein RFI_14824 [Reticulomyxa filosa]
MTNKSKNLKTKQNKKIGRKLNNHGYVNVYDSQACKYQLIKMQTLKKQTNKQTNKQCERSVNGIWMDNDESETLALYEIREGIIAGYYDSPDECPVFGRIDGMVCFFFFFLNVLRHVCVCVLVEYTNNDNNDNKQ